MSSGLLASPASTNATEPTAFGIPQAKLRNIRNANGLNVKANSSPTDDVAILTVIRRAVPT